MALVPVAEQFAHLRRDAEERLEAWDALDAAQRALRDRFVAHVRAHPDGVAKAGPPVHLTVGLIVLNPTLDRVLLTLHGKARRWFQFGGHLEAGDADLAAAAAREGREESGLAQLSPLGGIVDLDAHELPGAFGTCREHLDVRFAAVAPTDAAPVVSDESLDVAWWPVQALPEGQEGELGRLVKAARTHAARAIRMDLSESSVRHA